MSAHVPNTMTWQRKRGVFSSVASADRHQQTRRAMEASRSESLSVVRMLFTRVSMCNKCSKPGVECRACAQRGSITHPFATDRQNCLIQALCRASGDGMMKGQGGVGPAAAHIIEMGSKFAVSDQAREHRRDS